MRISILTYILPLLLFLQSVHLEAQTALIDSLLIKVNSCQQAKNNPAYSAGMFPSKRVYLKQKDYNKDDDNIFFTGLIVWTLRSNRNKLSEKNRLLVDSICKKAVANYPKYRNKNGGATYNFWQTSPSRHFPNDSYFSKHKKYALPDDLDDTSILYLSEQHADSLEHEVKAKMGHHANRMDKTIHNTFWKYRHRIAYSTWFGQKMPIDFDMSVHCNALRFVMDNKLELDEHDFETIHLLVDMVKEGDHLKYPHIVSPHYQNPNVVLYHLARLIAAYPRHHGLSDIKEKIIGDIQLQLMLPQPPMDRLILLTSLYRFGVSSKKEALVNPSDFHDFYFFVGNMTSTMINPLKTWLAKSKRTNFYYQSEGYYWCLLLENELLKNGL